MHNENVRIASSNPDVSLTLHCPILALDHAVVVLAVAVLRLAAFLLTLALTVGTLANLLQRGAQRLARARDPRDVVEATAKQVKHRMSGSGMHWSRNSAVNLLPFGAAELSGTFADYWTRRCP